MMQKTSLEFNWDNQADPAVFWDIEKKSLKIRHSHERLDSYINVKTILIKQRHIHIIDAKGQQRNKIYKNIAEYAKEQRCKDWTENIAAHDLGDLNTCDEQLREAYYRLKDEIKSCINDESRNTYIKFIAIIKSHLKRHDALYNNL